jgi:hypothetical protein
MIINIIKKNWRMIMKNNYEIAERDPLVIDKLLNDSIIFLEKGYLSDIKNFEIVQPNKEVIDFEYATGIRLIHLTKFTYDEKENILDKLSIYFLLYMLIIPLYF